VNKSRCAKSLTLAVLLSSWASSVSAQTASPNPAPPNDAPDAEVEVDSSASPTPVNAASPSVSTDSASAAGTPGGNAVPTTEPAQAMPSKGFQPDALPLPPRSATEASQSTARVETVQAQTGLLPVNISGYAQLQYESHRNSEDQLQQGASLLNQNRFVARRVRLEISRRYDYVGYLVELDGNTTNGPSLGLHRAEGSVFYPGDAPGQATLLEFTAGLLKLPFGYETPESSRNRWFMERTTASRAFFPNEVDVGIRLHGAWKFLRYGVALTNGEPKGTTFQLRDPNRAKDVLLRLGADVPVGDSLNISGGFSYLAGKGFHAGDDATKSRIVWTDRNENGAIDNGELTGVPGTAAVPSQNFRRWAIGGDLQIKFRSKLGWTSLFTEAVAAVNLDRSADPIGSGMMDAREFGWHVGFTQEITRYGLIGFRFDSYNPDSDLLDSRGGQFLPNNQTISTYSPVIGLAIPDRARLVFQYDFVRDKLGRDNTGVPTDLPNDQWTLRLQVNL
jgi:hypothetical protein